MAKRKQFRSMDIGAELLPIITTGLYRDPLDTLREYIQNSIDAKARHIDVKISADLVSIRDDGYGMSRDIAEKAIRLGISEKKPHDDVGFRGIGIYSAFNICKKLEIYTRTSSDEKSKIVFDFGEIRNRLEAEEELRKTGQGSFMCLEELMTGAVWVEDCDECPIAANGTMVMMIGVRGHIYKRLNAKDEVTRYLESVVPLPFHPDFIFKEEIEKKFRAEDYRVVDLDLTFAGRTQRLYRPYSNDMFTHGHGFNPCYFDLKNIFAQGNLGFAWVCLNDARKYLENRNLRGLLVKKFGFSVGDRDSFARFFSRAVFNNRVTGEIIITHKDLVPNAARSEFEHSDLRDSLYLEFSQVATQISKWANDIQQELKAREELETIAPKAFNLVKEIPSSERDIEQLLQYNIDITSFQDRLKSHTPMLRKLDSELLDNTASALSQAQKTITEILTAHKDKQRAKGRRRRITEAKKTTATAPDENSLKYAKDQPKSLQDVARAVDIDGSPPLELLIDYIDREVLQEKFSNNEYLDFLENLQSYLEDYL